VILSSGILAASTPETLEHRQRYEAVDIAKLATITRTDHSTIFFRGFTVSGYVRDGVMHRVDLKVVTGNPLLACAGQAVSRDGTRLAYIVPTSDRNGCEITVRDLRTGEDETLVSIGESFPTISWSWDDAEIAYHWRGGIMAVSTTNRSQRVLARLPLRIEGKPAPGSYTLGALDWLHQRPQLVADASICLPTSTPGTCQHEHHTLLLSLDDSRVLAVGASASVSPTQELVAFASPSHLELVGADGSHRRRVARIPALFGFAFLRAWVGPMTMWSPAGDRVVFGTILDEESNSDYYLVDIKSGKRLRLLKNTSLDLIAWR
jgi:hypothetical protein